MVFMRSKIFNRPVFSVNIVGRQFFWALSCFLLCFLLCFLFVADFLIRVSEHAEIHEARLKAAQEFVDHGVS